MANRVLEVARYIVEHPRTSTREELEWAHFLVDHNPPWRPKTKARGHTVHDWSWLGIAIASYVVCLRAGALSFALIFLICAVVYAFELAKKEPIGHG